LQNPNNLKLQIKDNGLPFNIIEHADPDITQEAKDRPIGGLGIFLSKRSCNNIKYQRKDNENIVTMSLEDDFDSD
jgi:anti-sigma regulatory factor (Ser/Thr protein kinase)